MPVIRTFDDRPVGPSLDGVVTTFLELEPWYHAVFQAKFYRDKDIDNAVETALINSSVTIPALPLEKKGKLYIGLVSYDEEKNTRLTTNLICLPIE